MLKSPTSKSQLIWRLLGSVLFVAAFAFFIWRGPWRGFSGGYDFGMIYGGAAAMADGKDPYVLADAAAAVAARGGRLDPTSVVLYPPSALAAFWPMTWMGWKAARAVWVVAQLLACIGLAAGLQRLAEEKLRRGLAGWLFMMCLLLWAPIHTGFFVGQVALPVAFLMVWAAVLAEDGKRFGAGMLLGLAIAIKPQLGLAFLPLLVLRGHWLSTFWSLAFFGCLYWLGSSRLNANAPDWAAHWQANLNAFTRGGYGDVALPWARAQMVQASAFLAALGIASAAALGYAVAAFIGCLWLLTHWSQRRDPLAVMAALSLVALLAGYHRSYDAVLALVPLAYGLRLVAESRRSMAGWALVVLLAVFLTPGGTGLAQVAPTATADGPWWVQFQSVALLLAALVCVGAGGARKQEMPS